MSKVCRQFYLSDAVTVAKALLGKYVVRSFEDTCIAGRIVETEAYIGSVDKACHAYGGKRTKRLEIMYGVGGYSYVYLIYGMYNCLNVVTGPIDEASAVLIRSVQIVKGMERAALLRYGKSYNELTSRRLKNISDGPGKLCRCMDITRNLNGKDLCNSEIIIANSLDGVDNPEFSITESKRIGIDYAEEAADFLWRFNAVKLG